MPASSKGPSPRTSCIRNGTVANTVKGSDPGELQNTYSKPATPGTYSFNVVATNSFITINSTTVSVTANPRPSGGAQCIQCAQSANGNHRPDFGRDRTITVNFIYSNGTVANNRNGVSPGGNATFSFLPKLAGTYTFNAVIYSDTGTTVCGFRFNTLKVSFQ